MENGGKSSNTFVWRQNALRYYYLVMTEGALREYSLWMAKLNQILGFH